ncbi:ATP-binding protein [Gordonia sp. L191]|uniref:sensor histidine kinase n=1 Tax=Gordonia sp. L191 TaxID=2982699 RepID=UPI0024BFDFD5|nr:ATP-binding protein [Gordonia sp. L191]WHU46018.1 ATP-binding protein [Gordonia sp. L191]
MTAAFIAGAIVAVVLALLLGYELGRGDVRGRWFRRLTRAAAPEPPESVQPASVHSDADVIPSGAPVVADRPREVPDSAALRESDLPVVTPDGQMTKAGLLSLIVRNSEVAVAVVDEFRDVVLYNHRAVELGLVSEHLLAEPVWEQSLTVLETGEQTRFDFVPPTSTLGFLSTGRATKRSAESVRCLARLGYHGDERYAMIYGTDDTENLRVEATRRDFVANVSHELKTPVGAIGLLAEALIESADDAESVEHFGHRVVAEATRMGNMVSELIALSRLEGGEKPHFAAVDVDELIDSAIDGAAVSAEAANIVLRADEPIHTWVRGDRMLLLTALSNLIVNAIAYSPENTTVSVSRRVTTSAGVPMVSIAVTDRGIGINPSDQQRVFERFFRVDKARSRLTGGTGLGLAIVKHVAATHDGTINLWSQPGTGSTFTLSIPQDLDAENAHASEESEKESRRADSQIA